MPRNNDEKKVVHFDLVPIPYSQILPYLIQKGCVTPKAFIPMIPPYSPNFDVNSRCEYHAGLFGNATDNCKALKYKV